MIIALVVEEKILYFIRFPVKTIEPLVKINIIRQFKVSKRVVRIDMYKDRLYKTEDDRVTRNS